MDNHGFAEISEHSVRRITACDHSEVPSRNNSTKQVDDASVERHGVEQ